MTMSAFRFYSTVNHDTPDTNKEKSNKKRFHFIYPVNELNMTTNRCCGSRGLTRQNILRSLSPIGPQNILALLISSVL